MNISEIFNNREIATGIWLVAALLFGLSNKKIRKSLFKVIRAFLRTKILYWLVLMVLYTIGLVAALKVIDFWNLNLLKNTILWFCFTGITSTFELVTLKNHEGTFRKLVIANIKLVVIIEFLVNTYTFSLLAEIAIIPIATFIAMLDAVARSDKKYSAVARLTTGLQALIGIAVLVLAIFKAISDYGNLLSIESLRSLLLPPALSVLFSPFIYLMLLFSTYELLFVRLKIGPYKDKTLRQYAKRRITVHVGLSLRKVKEFLRNKAIDLMKIQSRSDVDKMLT